MIAPPFMPEAVVFDLDGLLVDSEDAWRRATQRVVQDLDGRWDDAIHRLLLGSGPEEAARVLAEYLGNRHEATDIGSRLFAAASTEFANGIRLRPHARDLVRALHGRLPLAVATNSLRALADRALAGTGIAPWFETVVCADDVTAAKPAPDPYAMACAGCGADPSKSVALEDSPTGTMSAKAAGMWVIGCPSVAGVSLPAADVVVSSLTEVDADLLAGPRP